MSETGCGTSGAISHGGGGMRAIWQCVHSSGSFAANGKRPGQHAIQRDAERIEIGAVIHRAIHASGLFGRQVGPVGGARGATLG